MLGDSHLHIDENDQVSDLLSKALRSAKEGVLAISFENQPAVKIAISNGTLAVDLLEPTIFRIPEDETGLFDKLKTLSEFARKLSDNGVTLSFLRKDKEAVRLGKDAKPTLSKMVTGSDDIQLNSAREYAKLKGDLKTD
jgi:dihydroorotase